jgi:hypothetical protein
MKNYPIKFLAEKHSEAFDEVIDHELVSCEQCNCLQLRNLVDPTILYSMYHNNSKSPVWLTHHKILAEFIYDGLSDQLQKNIIEIGGSSGVIAEQLSLKNDVYYSIFDLCDHDPKIPNVAFQQGNCETFDFPPDASIVMSHVFEHLYEPRKFVKNMARNKIQNIFLSVPNMSLQMENKIHPVIYQEHTYLCELNDIEYIFSCYGYTLKKSYFYGIHAILLHFVYTPQMKPIELSRTRATVDKLIKVYEEKAEIAKNIVLDKAFYVIPACFSGQLIYYNLQDQYKSNCLGFLDNDTTKTNKRIYGTCHFVYRMEEIQKHEEPILIVIHRGAYVDEIVKQLKGLKPNIEFYYV